MKKLIVLPAAAMLLLSAVKAQNDEAALRTNISTINSETATLKKEKKADKKELKNLKSDEVNYQLKEQFVEDFGKVDPVQWTKDAGFDKATFTREGIQTNAWYDFNNSLVGTSSVKAFADLPSKAQKQINEKYAGYTKKQVIFFDDNELNETDMILYGQQFEDADNYFVELKKGTSEIVLQVNMNGDVSLFKQIS
ncbi:MAG: hypothetical protein QM791_04945 [Ferruginibacter sp.]